MGFATDTSAYLNHLFLVIPNGVMNAGKLRVGQPMALLYGLK